jgi:hypothetical protein
MRELVVMAAAIGTFLGAACASAGERYGAFAGVSTMGSLGSTKGVFLEGWGRIADVFSVDAGYSHYSRTYEGGHSEAHDLYGAGLALRGRGTGGRAFVRIIVGRLREETTYDRVGGNGQHSRFSYGDTETVAALGGGFDVAAGPVAFRIALDILKGEDARALRLSLGAGF